MAKRNDSAWVILTDKHEVEYAERILAATQKQGVPVRLVSVYPRTMSDQDAVANAVGIVFCLHDPRWSQHVALFDEIVKLPLLGGKGAVVAARASRYDEGVVDYFAKRGVELLLPKGEYMAEADAAVQMERLQRERHDR